MSARKKLSREEEIAAEIDRLQAMRGRSRQQQAELDWLLAVQEIDGLKAGLAGTTDTLNRTRKARNAAIAHKEGLRLRLEGLLGGDPEDVVTAVLENHELFSRMSAVNVAVAELKNRASTLEQENRVISRQLKQLTSRAMALKARAGIPG